MERQEWGWLGAYVASTFKKSNLSQMTGMSAMTLPLILHTGHWLTGLFSTRWITNATAAVGRHRAYV